MFGTSLIRGLPLLPLGLMAAALPARPAETAPPDMALIEGGSYQPFFARKDGPGLPTGSPGAAGTVDVKSFWLDRRPVTNGDYLAFLDRHPEWRKSAVKEVFAEGHYLQRWPSDRSWGDPQAERQPVTGVSWFAAQSYCQAQGKSLPTTDQWEYALADAGRDQAAIRDRLLAWYGLPNSAALPSVDQAEPNGYGVCGLAGLVWEWTLDFSGALAGSELRNSGDRNQGLFCGGGSLGARDASDYATFMRYAFRSSLKATYTTQNLGFRCAKEAS